jgi:hypothetical protein
MHGPALLSPSLTVPYAVPHNRLKCAYIHSKHREYADVVTVTVAVALLSFFIVQDVGVSVFLKCFC